MHILSCSHVQRKKCIAKNVGTPLRREASVWVKWTSLASWSVLSVVSGASLTTRRGLRAGEVDLFGLVVSPEYGQQVLTSLRREAPVWVKLTSLAAWSALSMVTVAYLTTKRGLRMDEVDLFGLVASPEYGQRCLPHY
jgi:hypothetical protein